MAARYKAAKYLEEIAESGIGDGCFTPEYVKEIDDAAKSVFSDVLKLCGANDTRDLTSDLFNKHSISKAQLAESSISCTVHTFFEGFPWHLVQQAVKVPGGQVLLTLTACRT